MFACYIASLDTLLAHSYHIRNLCVLVLIGTVIACFILSYYVTFSISDPLKKLNRVMKKQEAVNGQPDMRTADMTRSLHWEIVSTKWLKTPTS